MKNVPYAIKNINIKIIIRLRKCDFKCKHFRLHERRETKGIHFEIIFKIFFKLTNEVLGCNTLLVIIS